MVQVYVDMDGVLADFDKHYEDVFGVRPDKQTDNVDWNKVRKYHNFYANIPPMQDMRVLWTFCQRCSPPPIVLTGIPSGIPEAPTNKKMWIRSYLGAGIDVITGPSKEKYKHCKPGDILIDDWTKYKYLWEEAGGIFITHTSAHDSIKQLTRLIREGKGPKWNG